MKMHPLKLFRARQDPPFTQRQLAQYLGVTHAAICRWEKRVRTIELSLVKGIAEKTGIPINELRPDLDKILNPPPPNYRPAFITQRSNAKKRGIAWELTFEQWLKIWQDSGHLHLRGTRSGHYCMARNNDTGPYAVDNVKIISAAQNRLDDFKRYVRPNA